jgi:hypothetical protein
MQLVQAQEKDDQSQSNWVGLLKELKEAIQLLPEVKINHIRREQNQVAHSLAQLALQRDMCKTASFSVPPDIAPWVDRDKPADGSLRQCCSLSIS